MEPICLTYTPITTMLEEIIKHRVKVHGEVGGIRVLNLLEHGRTRLTMWIIAEITTLIMISANFLV